MSLPVYSDLCLSMHSSPTTHNPTGKDDFQRTLPAHTVPDTQQPTLNADLEVSQIFLERNLLHNQIVFFSLLPSAPAHMSLEPDTFGQRKLTSKQGQRPLVECSGIPENSPQGAISSAPGNDSSTQKPLCALYWDPSCFFCLLVLIWSPVSARRMFQFLLISTFSSHSQSALRLSPQYSGSKNSEQRGEDKWAEKRL